MWGGGDGKAGLCLWGKKKQKSKRQNEERRREKEGRRGGRREEDREGGGRARGREEDRAGGSPLKQETKAGADSIPSRRSVSIKRFSAAHRVIKLDPPPGDPVLGHLRQELGASQWPSSLTSWAASGSRSPRFPAPRCQGNQAGTFWRARREEARLAPATPGAAVGVWGVRVEGTGCAPSGVRSQGRFPKEVSRRGTCRLAGPSVQGGGAAVSLLSLLSPGAWMSCAASMHSSATNGVGFAFSFSILFKFKLVGGTWVLSG